MNSNIECNNDKIRNACYIGTALVTALGSFMHFAYELSGNNPIVGAFAAVNESVFEHLKLLAFPFLLFWLVVTVFSDKLFGKCVRKGSIAPVAFISAIAGMTGIFTLFYTYTGIIGRNFAIVDISLFVIGVLIAFYCMYRFLTGGKFTSKLSTVLGVIGCIALAAAMSLATFFPPEIPFFADPVSGLYGLK